MKQVPPHPRDKSKKATNKIKHPRNRMKNREGQISRQNVSKLMRGKISFSSKIY